jgi:hypothetical protein
MEVFGSADVSAPDRVDFTRHPQSSQMSVPMFMLLFPGKVGSVSGGGLLLP